MLEMQNDPRLPIFHNNTNVDFLTVGRQYGEPEQFFAELGTLIVEMKEEMAKVVATSTTSLHLRTYFLPVYL